MGKCIDAVDFYVIHIFPSYDIVVVFIDHLQGLYVIYQASAE